MLADICLGLVLLGVSAYAVLGAADFGAGFWDLTAGGASAGGRVRGLIQRSMSPVWEANHVWLIFILVMLWTAFPIAFGSIFSTLSIPLFLGAIGIIFRGAAFVLRGQAATIREARALGATFALSSVLIPFSFGAAIGGVASGRVVVGNAAGDPWSSWLNPTSVLIGVLAVASGTYLAAVYLAGAGAVTGLIAVGGLLVIRSDARELFDGLTSWPGIGLVALSAVAGLATLALVSTRRFGIARLTAAAAVVAITIGWAVAQKPYLLPGELTVDQAAAPDTTLTALVVGVGLGLILLVPSLWWLYRLVLQGRLDQEYEPLDQRFRPLGEIDGADR